MDVCVIGAGYVGLTTSAVLADLGHDVTCVDKNKDRIEILNRGICPIYEPGLEELIQKNRSRLTFSDGVGEAIRQNSVIYICVGTPPMPDGSTNLSYILSVIDDLATYIQSPKTIVTKSTVPLGTNEMIGELLTQKGVDRKQFNLVSNPEFLREGTAVYDMFNPDKTVVGLEDGDSESLQVMKALYDGIESPFVVTTLNDAELIKFSANAFLATKISFINEIARICDRSNADITTVASTIGLDPRIGRHFLQAGLGYGGSCFPKDLSSLIHSATNKGIKPAILEAAQYVNDTQLDYYIEKIKENLEDLSSKKVAVLGIAFKPDTDDIRSSRSVLLIEKLEELGLDVVAFDPKAKLPPETLQRTTQVDSINGATKDADCIVIATDWPVFKSLDWKEVKKEMKGTLIVDGRNCIDPSEVRKHGLLYVGVGRI
ncbi:UDP-glucose/GDP-mannose dehydrogenase family protein [Bacillus carboniphilus]|uniref:UDP-glucose 6-dehydrogenase n=1 Tax=Bacillus carboniphilus TaxID=86663 RepID=A0ABN0WLB9_9BACI